MRLRLIWLGLVALLLSGCQTLPPLNFSVPNVGVSQKKIDAELKSMTVTLARPDEQKGDIVAGMEPVAQLWQTSLTEALNRMAIFKDDASKKVSLQVKILGVEVPAAGASFETTAHARYEIIDRSNGSIIYTQEFSSKGFVSMGYAFLGVVRARESVNRAVQNNITMFLQALETVNIDKAMFPNKQK